MCCNNECKAEDARVELKVNGEEIELNPFTKGIICSCVTGLLKPLRGVDEIKDIALVIARSAATKQS